MLFIIISLTFALKSGQRKGKLVYRLQLRRFILVQVKLAPVAVVKTIIPIKANQKTFNFSI